MEQCIYCQSVYELDESDSSVPTSLCSVYCEEKFDEHQREIKRAFCIEETIKDNHEALKKLADS